MKTLLKTTILLTFTILAISQGFSPSCPKGLSPRNLYTDSFQISTAATAAIKLIESTQSQCFNYTLPSAFSANIEIAYAITEFHSTRRSDLVFSIKPLMSFLVNTIPFQVRLPWKYTQWIKLSINFMIESRKDIQSGFYQRDTGLVSACGQAKVQPVYLPFTSKWDIESKNIAVRVFLVGFEVATQQTRSGRSPYEIQLINTVYNSTGIIVQISSTSKTQVNTVYISYVVYDQKKIDITLVSGIIELSVVKNGISNLIKQNSITQFKYFIYGISGFNINQNFEPHIQVSIDSTFTFNLNSYSATVNYIGFQYIVFSYNPCNNCEGYPFLAVNVCVRECAEDTIKIGYNCFPCPINSHNVNGACVCSEGFYNISGACTTCELGQIWDGNECVGCAKNAIWVGNLCQCKQGFYNISGKCQSCPKGTNWNGKSCIICGMNSYWFGGSCRCNPGFNNVSGNCQKCPSGTVFNGKSCVFPCKPGENWNGKNCQGPCDKVGNSFWNGIQCICYDGFININGKCIKFPLEKSHQQNHHDHPTPPPTPPPGPANPCQNGQFYDAGQSKCLPCIQSCSQCSNAQQCKTCSTGFMLTTTKTCKQVCGDGLRFVVQCDDGNSIAGDGCSNDCLIQPGFVCKDGSPTSKDVCTPYTPAKTALVVTGQTITGPSTVVVNVKLNWAPSGTLVDSLCTHCTDLIVASVSQNSSNPSVSVNFVKGSSFSFAITINFGTQSFSTFSLQVQVNQSLQNSDFAGVDIKQKLKFKVNPSSLSNNNKKVNA